MSRYIRKRYIDAEVLKSYLNPISRKTDSHFLQLIDSIPTADVEEIRHGKDICYTKNDAHCEFKCSVCNAWIGVVEGGTDSLDAARGFNYCPACGAKLDKEEEE